MTRLNSGSALKFCQLAEGAGDLYPRFSPCCEWDTAAGQAVLEAAGGCLLDMAGQPLRYNCQDSLLSPHFYAIADAESCPLAAPVKQPPGLIRLDLPYSLSGRRVQIIPEGIECAPGL